MYIKSFLLSGLLSVHQWCTVTNKAIKKNNVTPSHHLIVQPAEGIFYIFVKSPLQRGFCVISFLTEISLKPL